MTNFETEIPESLIDAFRNTNYEVHTNPQFTFKVGEFCLDLENLFRESNLSTGCFITACNPESTKLSKEQNALLQETLHSDLVSQNLHIITGLGSDPSGEWEGEPSFLAIGISFSRAKSLGIKYKQNAIIWCDNRCTPELIVLR